MVRQEVDETHYGLQIPGENGHGHLKRPFNDLKGKPRVDEDEPEPEPDYDAIAKRAGRLLFVRGRWREAMDPAKAKRMAKLAKRCPFCGERLVVRDDHHGCWLAHKDELGGDCIVSVIQVLNEEDLQAWNQRA